jgi:glycolate oxidase iron-sulfur subunit
MQTHFSPEQLADPEIRHAESILRKCVHCGFCTATCPSYQVLGDELDSPRGRIVLIKDMLERDRAPSEAVVKHLDRCLSCLACTTTCPSGVDYMHLIDQARAHVERRYRRPLMDRGLRALLAWLLPRRALFRAALLAALPLRGFGSGLQGRLGALFRLVPGELPAPSPTDRPRVYPAAGERRMRVALLTGCVQSVVAPRINEATIRLLTRHGCEVVVASRTGCCGAIVHHLGKTEAARGHALAAIEAWSPEIWGDGLDAIVANASGCGTMLKDYGHLFRDDPAQAERAAAVAAKARDVSEVLTALGLRPAIPEAAGMRVAYHAACSLQHGQKIEKAPKALLEAAGFTVLDVPEGHLCCGSAGTYNILQPEIAEALKARKLANIRGLDAEFLAAGNLGCMVQLGEIGIPVFHTVELLDWATGGPRPEGIA